MIKELRKQGDEKKQSMSLRQCKTFCTCFKHENLQTYANTGIIS